MPRRPRERPDLNDPDRARERRPDRIRPRRQSRSPGHASIGETRAQRGGMRDGPLSPVIRVGEQLAIGYAMVRCRRGRFGEYAPGEGGGETTKPEATRPPAGDMIR